MNLAEKWNIISNIWHSNSDLDFLYKNISSFKNKNICDIAAGNGFHSIDLKKQGLNVVALDGMAGNVSQIIKNMINANVEFPVIYSKWQNLKFLKELKFDIILCLGTSITYYDCWDEKVSTLKKLNWNEIVNILDNIKRITTKGGKIYFGISNYYLHNKKEKKIIFKTKTISGNKYQMNWKLFFDWEQREKFFFCTIKRNGSFYFNLELRSHLFTAEEFLKIAKKKFNDCKLLNINNNLYDNIIVCQN